MTSIKFKFKQSPKNIMIPACNLYGSAANIIVGTESLSYFFFILFCFSCWADHLINKLSREYFVESANHYILNLLDLISG